MIPEVTYQGSCAREAMRGPYHTSVLPWKMPKQEKRTPLGAHVSWQQRVMSAAAKAGAARKADRLRREDAASTALSSRQPWDELPPRQRPLEHAEEPTEREIVAAYDYVTGKQVG